VTDDRNAAEPAGTSQRPANACFDTLVRVLTDQLHAARRGRLDRVRELAEHARTLSAEARDAGLRLPDADRRRLLGLHGKVRLALAQQQADLARRRERLRRGKGGIRGYANDTGNR